MQWNVKFSIFFIILEIRSVAVHLKQIAYVMIAQYFYFLVIWIFWKHMHIVFAFPSILHMQCFVSNLLMPISIFLSISIQQAFPLKSLWSWGISKLFQGQDCLVGGSVRTKFFSDKIFCLKKSRKRFTL